MYLNSNLLGINYNYRDNIIWAKIKRRKNPQLLSRSLNKITIHSLNRLSKISTMLKNCSDRSTKRVLLRPRSVINMRRSLRKLSLLWVLHVIKMLRCPGHSTCVVSVITTWVTSKEPFSISLLLLESKKIRKLKKIPIRRKRKKNSLTTTILRACSITNWASLMRLFNITNSLLNTMRRMECITITWVWLIPDLIMLTLQLSHIWRHWSTSTNPPKWITFTKLNSTWVFAIGERECYKNLLSAWRQLLVWNLIRLQLITILPFHILKMSSSMKHWLITPKL